MMLLEDQEVAVKLWGQDSLTVAPEGQGGEFNDPEVRWRRMACAQALKVCSVVLMGKG